MARFTETVDIRQAPTITLGAEGLTARLDQFAAQKANQYAQETAERSYAAGQAAFVEGEQPQFKEERAFGRVGSENYNKGLRAAYVASIDRDNREEIARIAAENPNNLAAFNDAAASYRSATLNNVDPSARLAVADSLDSMISGNRIRVQTNQIENTHKENQRVVAGHIDSAVGDAMSFARNGDKRASAESAIASFSAIDGAVEAGFLTPTQAADQKRAIERSITEESLKGELLRTFDEVSPQAALNDLDALSEKTPKGFTPEEWGDFVTSAQGEIKQKLARQEKQIKASQEDIKKQLAFGDIEARLKGDDSIVMQPKFVDMFYQEKLAPSLERMPPESRQAAQAEFMDRTKVMPATIKGQIVNAANSMNPELIQESALLVDRVDQIPGVVNDLPTHEQAYIQNVANLMQNMTGSEAMDLAMKSTDPKDKPRIEAAESALKEAKRKEPNLYNDRAFEAFERSFIFSDPTMTDSARAQMTKEYGDTYEEFVKAGMNDADAHVKASSAIQRNWGETEVLGRKEVMKFPPDLYYSIDGDVEWVSAQLMEDITNPVGGAVAGMNISQENVYLMSNDQTARFASQGRPSYMVNVMIDGMLHPVGNWAPDMDAEITKRKEENVKEAMERRKRATKGNLNMDDATFDAVMSLPGAF